MSLYESINPNGSGLFGEASNLISSQIPADIKNNIIELGGLVDSSLISSYLPDNGIGGIAQQLLQQITPTPLMGGITALEAKKIYREALSIKRSNTNLFLVEFSSRLMGDVSGKMNMFVTSLDYTPFSVSGEKVQLGSAQVDLVNSSEPVELMLTTLDNKSGFVKEWFARHCAIATREDGTVGLPFEYAIKIRIVQAYISNLSALFGGAYADVGLFRPANIDVSLSRSDDSVQSLSLSFSQLDTFMSS